MKGNLLNKVWLRVVMIVAVMTTTFAGTTWATEQVYKTALFGQEYSSTSVTTFTNTPWTATNNGFSLTLVQFKNHSANEERWYTYIACGQSGTAHTATATTTDPIDKAITKVRVTIDEINSNYINSLKLQTSTDGNTWTDAANIPQRQGQQTVTLSSPAENLYYRVEVNCASGPKGNFFKIGKIEYIRNNAGLVEAPVISGNQVFTSTTEVTITCATPGSSIQYSIDKGINWIDYEGALTLDETTTVMAKATAEDMDENQSSKVFTHMDNYEDFTWDLTEAPNGTISNNKVTWIDAENGEVTMSLEKVSTSQNANTHLGGNDGTYFYKNQKLTIAPEEDYTIISVKITLASADDASQFRAWTNAQATTEDNVMTVIPTISTEPIYVDFNGETHVLGVEVECSEASSPYVTAKNTLTVISGTSNGTIDVVYNRFDDTSAAQFRLCNADHSDATYNWITVRLNGDKDIVYTITQPNLTAEPRTAYVMAYLDLDEYYCIVAVTQEASIPVTITSVGYSTLYYGQKNLVVPEGVTAATYNVVDGKLTQSSTYNVIPAGSGVVLSASQGTYYFYESLTADEKDSNNKLRGSDEVAQTTGGNYYYALTLNASRDPKSVGFYWMDEEGKAFDNGAHKAYLALDTMFAEPSAGVKSFFTLLDDDDPTGIENVNVNLNNSENIYNVAGQRLSKMQKGINIINGKKILK